jgi:hypothetical protein
MMFNKINAFRGSFEKVQKTGKMGATKSWEL